MKCKTQRLSKKTRSFSRISTNIWYFMDLRNIMQFPLEPAIAVETWTWVVCVLALWSAITVVIRQQCFMLAWPPEAPQPLQAGRPMRNAATDRGHLNPGKKSFFPGFTRRFFHSAHKLHFGRGAKQPRTDYAILAFQYTRLADPEICVVLQIAALGA